MAKRNIKDYQTVSLKPESIEGSLNFKDVFGRKAPVHIEIGSGKGTFLVHQAKAQPDINFLGIEWANKFYKHAVDRIGRWALPNVRLIRTDVAAFLPEHVSDASISCFHIYFPDPWPKKRHHKRRFICGVNFAQMIRCLETDGLVNIATDHAGYFEQISEVIDAEIATGRVQKTDFVRSAGAQENEAVGTNYERKYLKAQKPIYTIAVKKK